MSKINDLLLEVSHLKNQSELQLHFDSVADYLFNHVVIKAGDYVFTFIEVEFYYYKKGVFEGRLFNCTYPRTRDAGQLFWHYSGIDICFESKTEKYAFGGILIRSLMKNGKEIIAGPMRCSDELLNSCKKELPFLVETEQASKHTFTSTFRYGIKADKEQTGPTMHLRYYVKPTTWTRIRENVLMADENSGGYKIVPNKKEYYTAQPEKR